MILFLLGLSLVSASNAAGADTSKLRIVFAGDIMGHDSQIIAAYDDSTGTYRYHSCFEHIRPFLEEADIAMGNLEVTLAGPPYQGYPQFSSPDALATALRESGFDILINANNHALDAGNKGFVRTHHVIDSLSIISTGSFTDIHQRELVYPLLVEKNNILLAILNFTYGTNGLKADSPLIVNYLDTLEIRRDLEKVKLLNPDFIIACPHWGLEYERTENSSQKQVSEFLFRNGVNAIIGSHPHVIQPVRTFYDSPDSIRMQLAVYSLGNLISNQRDRYRNGGIIFGLELEKSSETRISHFDYLPVYVHKPVIGGKTGFQLLPANLSQAGQDSIGISDPEKQSMKQFYEDTRSHLSDVPEKRMVKD